MGHALLLVWDSSVGAREVLPYMGYVGLGGPKGFGFSAVLVIYFQTVYK